MLRQPTRGVGPASGALQERFGPDWFNPEDWFFDNSGVTSGGVHLHCGIIACTIYFSRYITSTMAEQGAWEPAKATGALCATLPALAGTIAAKGGLVGVAAEAVAAPVIAAAGFEGAIAAGMCGAAVGFYGYTGWWTAKEAKSKNKCLSLRNDNVFNPFGVPTWTASGGDHCHDN